MDYKELYYDLFNTITDTIENLKEAQLKAEEKYLEMTDCEDREKKARIIKFKK